MASVMESFSGCTVCHVAIVGLASFFVKGHSGGFRFVWRPTVLGSLNKPSSVGPLVCVCVSDNCTHVSLQDSFSDNFQLVYAPRWAKVA